jgi:hypothetical protein
MSRGSSHLTPGSVMRTENGDAERTSLSFARTRPGRKWLIC